MKASRIILSFFSGSSIALHAASAWGRPVDLANMPDSSLLVSDDRAGAIYRTIYQK